MTDIVVRSIEIFTGSILIVATLLAASAETSPVLQGNIILLPLFALPLVFSGLFNWHPARALGERIYRVNSPVRELNPVKAGISPH